MAYSKTIRKQKLDKARKHINSAIQELLDLYIVDKDKNAFDVKQTLHEIEEFLKNMKRG